jgi:hypothetical protein
VSSQVLRLLGDERFGYLEEVMAEHGNFSPVSVLTAVGIRHRGTENLASL